MTFASLGLIDPLLRMLDSVGYTEPTPIQKQAIPAVLAGRDLMAAAQTGTGKTGGFAIPLLQRLTMEGERAAPNAVRCLVLVPTRELAEQVYESFRGYGRNVPMRCHVAYGGVPIDPQIAKLNKGLDVLVATPGRLLDLYRQGALHFQQLQSVVLDEADRMLDLGFSRDLEAILEALPEGRQTLLFSATFSDAIRELAKGLLNDPLSLQVSPRNAAAKSVRQWAITTDKKSKPELFLYLLRKLEWGQALVFVKTRKGVDALVDYLRSQGVSADSIHGDKQQHARQRALDKFKAGMTQILVATDVAARGLDIDTLPLVVNFDLPTVAEDYVHRIGRTGRAGAEGEAISLICADEVDLLRAIEKLTRQTLPRQEVPGYEADHRVPETGPAAVKAAAAAKAAAKGGARGGVKGGTKEGTAAADARPPKRVPAGPEAKPDPELPLSSDPRFRDGSEPFALPVAAAPRAASPGKARARPAGGHGATGRGGGKASAPAVPKGAVVVTGGRGAKSTARSAAKAAAKPPAYGPKRGAKR
ncbi:DEAD/DEAH box helicase [Pseudoduganella namucuonensis]|uniref:DEAD-box ATP-dependent RNA helicase RhpA n=1 Tax=Pseudoduganella namucuonensis TaxID=1035707 RepID=A0A1I7HMS5_9BURK|nr:DEAD/DEAH box helicase [Pseudoduganella namucuonensis]SFU61879.1 Superfamily II DNA and RNA helicase [Pseudoduganella namucuonensis]